MCQARRVCLRFDETAKTSALPYAVEMGGRETFWELDVIILALSAAVHKNSTSMLVHRAPSQTSQRPSTLSPSLPFFLNTVQLSRLLFRQLSEGSRRSARDRRSSHNLIWERDRL